ncbi:MAG: DUF3368 domain-containing protein [Thermodesulfobacteriota bacterium]
MTRKWVLNSSPVIILAKVSLIWILEEMCARIVIPSGVAHEVKRGPANDVARSWLEGAGDKHVVRIESVDARVAAWDLGRGESEVISIAYISPEHEAILDDRAARKCAQALGIRVRGTVGVLLAAKRAGVLPQIAPILAQLPGHGLRLGKDLLQAAIRLSGET